MIKQDRMTVHQALEANYKVVGKTSFGYSEAAIGLSYTEAQRFYDSLILREFNEIKVVAYFDDKVFFNY